MVSKKRSSARASNTAKKVKNSQEESVAVSTEIDAPQPFDSCVEFVTIKEEPIDIGSPTSSYDRQSPVDPSPKRSSVCELCLRKCPPEVVVQFPSGGGSNHADGLEKVNQAVGIQLELEPLSVCRTCWQLVEIVVTFKDGCLKAKDCRMLEGGFTRDGVEKDEWFSEKTAKAMEYTLQIAQANLDYFSNQSEEVLEPEDGQDDNSFNNEEVSVKTEADSADEVDDLDETTESQTKLQENSKVTKNSLSSARKAKMKTIGSDPKKCARKTRKPPIEIPLDLTPFPVYECTKCGRRFDSKNGLGIHVRHTEDSPDAVCKNSVPLESPHCCTVCKLYFKSRALLKCHIDKHLGTKSLACRKGCGKMFYTGAMLRVHEHNCGTQQGNWLCPHCGINFVSTSHLNRHMTQVHGEANFPCKDCGKLFKTREAVARHMTFSHSTENMLSCKLCAKKYKNPDSLRVHMRLHTNEMPYGCDICGKRFRYGHAVRPHMFREHGWGVEEAVEDGSDEEAMEEGDGGE